jgi:hypothetical protein
MERGVGYPREFNSPSLGCFLQGYSEDKRENLLRGKINVKCYESFK